MRCSKRLIVILQVVGLVLLVSINVAAQASGPNASDISYTISMPKPWTHLFEVEMNLKIPANLNVRNETDLLMPVWTPGSYLVREFERQVQDFSATDAMGRSLEWSKVNKNTWRIKSNGAR